MKRLFLGPPARFLALAVAGMLLTTVIEPVGGGCPAAARARLYIEGEGRPEFLNNRAGGIIGSSPLAAAGLPAGGLTGRGEVVAVADSGLDIGMEGEALHPDFRDNERVPNKVVGLLSFGSAKKASDPNGHGTHVAGTVLGSGAASDGRYRGIAPDAALFFQSILGASGDIDLPADLGQLFEPAYQAGARIQLASWGREGNAYLASSSQIDRYVREHPDFLVVLGAGNAGEGQGAAGTITAEANAKNALVVGASENPRPAFGPGSDRVTDVATFSSRGPAGDGRTRPDVVAPGSAIISTKSSLVEGNFSPNQYYTRMDGTSMAAAVAAGGAALLRQYFRIQAVETPSAALLKATLINGARNLGHNRTAQGYGLIDLAGTVLALDQQSMSWRDNRQGLLEGDEQTYIYTVTDAGAPLRVTVAWTDPPANPGAASALVNDLDLVVTAPDGRIYLGNDFAGVGAPDRVNNVEQVSIVNPQPGEYRIAVVGRRLAATSQDFAIVYGQLPDHGIVDWFDPEGRAILLRGGLLVDVAPDARVVTPSPVLPGADVYLFEKGGQARAVYAFQETAELTGMQGDYSNGVPFVSDVNLAKSEGGFPVSDLSRLRVNGSPAGNITEIVPGSDVNGVVTPSTGELSSVSAGYMHIPLAFLDTVDLDRKAIQLWGYPTRYGVDDEAYIRVVEDLEGPAYDLPYAYPPTMGLRELTPLAPVSLTVSPRSGLVSYLEVRQKRIWGILSAVDETRGELSLREGQRLRITAQTMLYHNGRAASLTDLQPGDEIRAVIRQASSDIALEVEAVSLTEYGKVVHVTGNGDSIVFMDYAGKVHLLQLERTAQVYWRGVPSGVPAIRVGDHVRLSLEPAQRSVWRVDVALVADDGTKPGMFKAFDRGNGLILAADGTRWRVTDKTIVTKNGARVRAEDLVPGEEIVVTSLFSALSKGEHILASVQARAREGVAPPQLEARLDGQDWFGPTVIRGSTSSAKVYIYVNGSSEVYTPQVNQKSGEFEQVLPGTGAGSYRWQSQVDVVAVGQDGGVSSIALRPERFSEPPRFADIRNHWAESDIWQLAVGGILGGYPDGAFYPDKPITRAEFVALIHRAFAWPEPSPDAVLPFSDSALIPAWARPAVAMAYLQDVVRGYGEDRSFRPEQPITRAEMTVMLIRALGRESTRTTRVPEGIQDWNEVPWWARQAAAEAVRLRLVSGRAGNAGNLLSPSSSASRAEASVVALRAMRLMGKVTGGVN